MSIEAALEYYADNYSEELVLSLLKVLAYPSQGGLGYEIVTHDPWIESDGWHVDDGALKIYIDTHGFFGGANDVENQASQLRGAIEQHFLGYASVLERYGLGVVKVVFGVVEVGVGVVGIIVPEPGTTVAGVALTVLGTNTIVDGVSQIGGANQGHGVNVLSEAFGMVGSSLADLAGVDPALGEQIGEGTFFIASLAIGTIASFRVLHAPGAAWRFGVGGQPGGLEAGRLHLLMPNARAGGMTVFSIVDNQGRSFLRFVTQNGMLHVNARIVGVSNLLRHEPLTNWRVVAKALLTLLWHGAKVGM